MTTNGYDDMEARYLNVVPDLKVENCTSSRCVTCRAGILNTDFTFKSFLTGQNFEVEDRVNCKTTHVVYLIRCKHLGCEMQYVGQTTSSVANDTFSLHFLNIHGNNTNCDTFTAISKCISHKFSEIGLAETNTQPDNKNLYEHDNYSSIYQTCAESKTKVATWLCIFKTITTSQKFPTHRS